MTKEDAIQLIQAYGQYAKDAGCKDDTLTDIGRRWPSDGSERKAMRWLGFMQGAMYQSGYFTLEEIKHHSMDRKVPKYDDKDGEHDG